MESRNCPGLLTEGYATYSPLFLRRMFAARKVSHILPYDAPETDGDDQDKFIQNRKRISISGAQEKYSVLLDKNSLRLTIGKERGSYILKPKPHGLRKTAMAPANEHVTMQIASQVYGIPTAVNGLVFFSNGEAAYLTKRFDIDTNGDYVLSPAYDLMDTRIHVDEEGFFALNDELFKE